MPLKKFRTPKHPFIEYYYIKNKNIDRIFDKVINPCKFIIPVKQLNSRFEKASNILKYSRCSKKDPGFHGL